MKKLLYSIFCLVPMLCLGAQLGPEAFPTNHFTKTISGVGGNIRYTIQINTNTFPEGGGAGGSITNLNGVSPISISGTNVSISATAIPLTNSAGTIIPISGGGTNITIPGTFNSGPPASGLLARYSADDLSGTDGTVITSWPDKSGNGNTATGAASGANPGGKIYNSVVGHHKAVRFFGSGEVSPENNRFALPGSLSVNASALSYFVISREFYSGDAAFVAFGGSGFTGNIQYRGEGTDHRFYYPVWDGVLFTPTYKPRMNAGINLHGIVMATNELSAASTRVRHYINFLSVLGAPNTRPTQNFTGGFIGGNGIDSYAYAGDLFEVLVYDHALSQEEVQGVQRWAFYNYPVLLGESVQVYCFGDSLTGGGGSGTGGVRVNNVYPYQLAYDLGPSYSAYNFGFGGATLTSIKDTLNTYTNQIYQMNRAASIIVLQGGVNDIINGTNAAGCYSNAVALALAAKNTGATVYFLTCTYHGGGAVNDAFNTSLRSSLITDTGIDGLIDVQSDTRLTNNALAAYSHDAIHYTDAGCKVVAAIVSQAIMSRTSSVQTMPYGIKTPTVNATTSITLAGTTKTSWPSVPTGTMVESGITTAGMVPMTSDTTGTNYGVSPINVSTVTNTTVTGNLTAYNGFLTNTLGIGVAVSAGNTLEAQGVSGQHTYMHLRANLNTKEASLYFWDRTFNAWIFNMRNDVDTPNDRFRIVRDSAEVMTFLTGGNIGIGTNNPASKLYVMGSIVATNDINAQTTLTVGASGAPVKNILSNTATLDFANLAAIGCEDLTITVTGAALGDTVSIGVPNASVVANGTFTGWVSSADTITIRFCTVVSGDPASGTFRATVTKF